MTTTRKPSVEVNFADLPIDPRERHEALVDLFGRYILLLRSTAVNGPSELVESGPARDQLASLQRRVYDVVGAFEPPQRAAACQLAEETVDRFIKLFLTLLSGIGTDQRLDDHHAIRFKLDLEIIEVEEMNVLETETLNRGGAKSFASYWGRWLNIC